MNNNNLIDKFIKFEQINNLYSRYYFDFNYWCHIRFDIYNEIYRIINKTSPISLKGKKEKKTKIKEKLIKFKDISESIIKQPRGKKDIIIMQHPRKLFINGYYQDIYTNYLAENYYSHSIIIDCQSTSYYPKQKYNYIKDDISLIWKYFYKITLKKDNNENMFLINLQNQLEQYFNIELPNNFLSQLIHRRFILYKSYYKYYSSLLKKVSPKCIIEVVYYSITNMVLNEVAQKMNIPTIELQHGTMGYNHIAYNLQSEINLKQLPSYMFLFSEYWKKNSNLPLQTHIKITGYPYFEEQYNKYIDIHKRKNNLKGKKNILFISQTTIGIELSKFASQLADLIDHNKYTIQYKFHPAEYDQWPQRMPWLYQKKEYINIIDDKNQTLYELFAASDIQIGVYSTGIYEGLAFNLKTYIINLPGWEGMNSLIQEHYAQLISSPEELISILKEQESIKENKTKITFWKENSKENIIKEINKIIANA